MVALQLRRHRASHLTAWKSFPPLPKPKETTTTTDDVDESNRTTSLFHPKAYHHAFVLDPDILGDEMVTPA
ncbi:hypothetical protein XA68_14588 [Ophiocordyceps unilateralis]|uniref:Uncharacterized protein n=1 Tax=Ophiocordyceps unilateralis TaxID=268505 RepID=A0A2A9P9R9_OPHUN|nr:hypothetical protein XA68_14588 [Ophiocordyceps unilateralis]